jgi:hypothetical protein
MAKTPAASSVHVASRGLRRFQSELGFYEAVELMDKCLKVAKRIPKFDCSSGAGRLSVPQQHLASALNDAGRGERDRTGLAPLGPLLRVHEVGKKAVGQLPNAALLGALVLVSNELIKREYTSKSTTLPPYIRDIANSTLAELDTKLKTLSEIEWYDKAIKTPLKPSYSGQEIYLLTCCSTDNSGPNSDLTHTNIYIYIYITNRSVETLLAKETDAQLQRLSAQPLELVDYIDQYLVRDLLPRIDKELSPFLSTLITDPAEVQNITARWEQLCFLWTSVYITS